MKYLSIIISLIFLIGFFFIAANNLQIVKMQLFGFSYEGPLAAIIFIVFFLGFVASGIFFLPKLLASNYSARKNERENKALKKELEGAGMEKGMKLTE